MENANLPHELFLWTHSSIVLGWVRNPPNSLETFVANHVAKTMSITSNSNWKYVKAVDNLTDLRASGYPPNELIDLWWHGSPSYRNPVIFGRNLELSTLLTWRQ